jgi:ketosteroid isomerase-like protein
MSNNTEQEILTQEQNLTKASQRLDIDALDRFYANDILFTGVTGAVCDKSSVMDEARRGLAERGQAGTAVTYEKEDLRVVTHGDTAVTSYRFTVNFRIPDREAMTNRFRTTNVWMKRPGGWQVVAAHTSKLD